MKSLEMALRRTHQSDGLASVRPETLDGSIQIGNVPVCRCKNGFIKRCRARIPDARENILLADFRARSGIEDQLFDFAPIALPVFTQNTRQSLQCCGFNADTGFAQYGSCKPCPPFFIIGIAGQRGTIIS